MRPKNQNHGRYTKTCPVCGMGPYHSRAMFMGHLAIAHAESDSASVLDLIEDSYSALYPGIKRMEKLVDSRMKAALEVAELERVYGLSSGPIGTVAGNGKRKAKSGKPKLKAKSTRSRATSTTRRKSG